MQINKFSVALTAARFLLALTTSLVLSTALILANAAAATVSEKAIHTFPPGNKQGADPVASLIFDAAGNLYGATDVGGTGCGDGCGTVYELTPKSSGSWTETVLYTFKGGNDGAHPYAGLILDSAGNLYGTTQQGGGTGCARTGCGTVFELTPSSNGSWVEKVLYSFQGGNDGVWRSSNDSPLLNSNSVLHPGCSRLRHETARPQLANSARFPALCPRPPGS